MLASHFMLVIAGLLCIPVAVVLTEIIAASMYPHPQVRTRLNPRQSNVAVVVPAHNEGRGLIPTLLDVKVQLRPTDRLIVVADNCSDDTARVAARIGAEVLERQDHSKIGKGYAMDFAVRHLKKMPPDVVLFVDADCRVDEGALEELVSACVITSRPAQALDLMTAPPKSEFSHQIPEFAWLTRNLVRPLGLSALGLPCQLNGTGMAFPWKIISAVNLANGQLAEDLNLGLALASVGHAAIFCPSARVSSVFPSSAAANITQRQRWEGGHIEAIASLAPRYLLQSVVKRNFGLFVLTLDLIVPPLSLFALTLVGTLMASSLVVVAGGATTPLIVSFTNTIAFGFGVFLCWNRFGRDVLHIRALLRLPYYVINKLPVYKRIFSGRSESRWVRTERADARGPEQSRPDEAP